MLNRAEEPARGHRGLGGVTTACQTALIGSVWAWLCWLHASNDGLWADDAARHFANGQFWKDYLLSLRLDAWDYAMSYYARYPVIKPSAYPPIFYLAEASLFGVFAPSPFLAKGLVLGSTLVAALYTAAWIRRWIAVEAGWAAAILVLMPGVVTWSHAVMLHMPALALATASLFHVRRWLESGDSAPDWRQFWLGVLFGTLGVFTYFQAGVVAVVTLAWIGVERRGRLLMRREVLPVLVAAAILLVFGVLALSRWAPAHLEWVVPQLDVILDPASWTYYQAALPHLFTWHLVALALLGALTGLSMRRWRSEARTLLTWCVATYAFFSYLDAKQARYILFLGPPIVCLVVVGVYGLSTALAGLVSRIRPGRDLAVPLASGALGLLLLVQVGMAARQPVPSIRGFREVVAYVEELVPEGAVFYDGYHHGIFVAYTQAEDPEYRRRVVLGSKLLYAYAVNTGWRLEEFVDSPDEAVDLLRRRGGARVLVIEHGDAEEVGAQKHLREAVRGAPFELLRSFPIEASALDRLDVYKMSGAIDAAETVDLPFPILGSGVRYSVEPIER